MPVIDPPGTLPPATHPGPLSLGSAIWLGDRFTIMHGQTTTGRLQTNPGAQQPMQHHGATARPLTTE